MFKSNEAADKIVKEATLMPSAWLPYTDYYPTIRKVRKTNDKGSGKTILPNYSTLNLTLKSEKMFTIVLVMQTMHSSYWSNIIYSYI